MAPMSMPLVARNKHVRRDAIQLGHQHADPLRPRDVVFDAEELLGRHREHELVEERRRVVHARDVGGPLQEREVFAGLLHAGVQVADDRLGAQHGLAVELEHEAQHAVRRRVLRTHVDDHRLVVAGVARSRARPPRPPTCAARCPSRAAAPRPSCPCAAAAPARPRTSPCRARHHRAFSIPLNCTGMRPMA